MKKFLAVMLLIVMSAVCLSFAFAETAESVDSVDSAAVETAVSAEETEEAPEEETKEAWSSYAFGKLGKVQWYTWAVLAILVVFGIVMFVKGGVNWTTRRISYAAMCIALSFILSIIRLYRMPQGGSITLISKLPLILFTMACGPAYGLVAGCAAGFIALIFDPYVIHPIQLLVDYPFASGAVALAFVAKYLPIKRDNVKLAAATVFGYLGAYIMNVLSGAVFFGEYAWEGYSAWGYSLAYNATYCWPECAICVILVLAIPGIDRLVKLIGRKA